MITDDCTQTSWWANVLIMFSTECPSQTKEPLWMLQLPESLGLNGSYLCPLFPRWITFFWLQHHIGPCSYKCTYKTHNPVFTVSTNTSRLLQSWQRLPSSGDTEGACCLFVSSSALFPLECYITAGGGKEERKSRICRLLTPPVPPHPSIHFPFFIQQCSCVFS